MFNALADRQSESGAAVVVVLVEWTTTRQFIEVTLFMVRREGCYLLVQGANHIIILFQSVFGIVANYYIKTIVIIYNGRKPVSFPGVWCGLDIVRRKLILRSAAVTTIIYNSVLYCDIPNSYKNHRHHIYRSIAVVTNKVCKT